MHSLKSGMLLLSAGISLAACTDVTSSARNRVSSSALAAAFSSATLGAGSLVTSFVGSPAPSAGNGDLWVGGGRNAAFDRGSMMGGGIADAFVGGVGRGDGRGDDGPFGGGFASCNGSYAPSTGRVSCAVQTLPNGLAVNRSFAFTDANGNPQQAFDSLTTNAINTQSSVSGTVTYTAGSDSAGQHGGRGGYCDGRGDRGLLLGDTAKIVSATTTVASSSSRTVTGLASGSSQRIVNGVSASTESTDGASSRGQFTATRVAADTTSGLVVPLPTSASGPPYPTAGTVIRVMKATLTYSGASTASVSRREVVTYDGSATAKVLVTENDSTRSCTKPLPRGPLSCS